jgi:hypothetical protein
VVQLLQRQVETSLVKRVKHFILGQLAAAVRVEKTEGVLELLDGGIAAESRPKLPREVTQEEIRSALSVQI